MHNQWVKYIQLALEEDMSYEDITTQAIMPDNRGCRVKLFAKADGIIAGLPVFELVFLQLGIIHFTWYIEEGACVREGQLLGLLEGSVHVILAGERTALNYLQRMSGIATLTRHYVDLLAGTKTTLLDTRKTTPCMRAFEKYAVKIGGAMNHRYNLSDGIMLKDNHVDAAGGVTQAIEAARKQCSFIRKIEVEVESLEQVREAVAAGADIIMLDNMSDEMMRAAVQLIDGRALTECSGNVTEGRLRAIAKTGVDYVSCGALTHSAPILDLSLKELVMDGD